MSSCERARLIGLCRALALAPAFVMICGADAAMAQTVIVRSAPPGSTVEVVLNAAPLTSATVDAAGDARLAFNLTTAAGKTETDVSIYVDVCDKVRRVVFVERGMQPPPQGADCERRQIVGLFIVRRVSTLVVNVGGPNPTVLLRQGSVDLSPPRAWSSAPTGLIVFGGAGLATFRDAVAIACGNVTPCDGDETRFTYTGGAAYWITRFLAVEGSYVKAANVTVTGSGNTFRFDSFLEPHLATVSGKVGLPLGPVRLYGQVGANYHRATFGTTQTVDDVTVTIDGVEQTIEGATQTFEQKTAGWGWQLGGGAEAWVAARLAIYAEAARFVIKGSARDDSEGSIDERVTAYLFGARIRIGK